MSIWSAVGNAFGSLAGNWLTKWGEDSMNSHYSRELMDYQYNLERQSRQNYYQDAKSSLLDAGYNPLLAVMGGSSAQSLGVNTPTMGEGLNQVKTAQQANANQARQLGIAESQARADNTLKYAQADTETTKQNLNIADTLMRRAEVIREQFNNTKLPERYKYEMLNNAKNLELMGSQIYNNMTTANASMVGAKAQERSSFANMISANARDFDSKTNRINAYTNKFNAVTNRYDAFANMITAKTRQQEQNRSDEITNAQREWARKHPIQARWTYGLSQWSGALGAALGGAGIGAGGYAAIKKTIKEKRVPYPYKTRVGKLK